VQTGLALYDLTPPYALSRDTIAEREITNYRVTGLREALAIEKQKKQRSKRLNLIGKLLEGKL
jgi:hypothetical protein